MNSDISGFGEVVDGRQKVGGLRQKGVVSIDEGNYMAHKGACLVRHWDFQEFVEF